jgi:hypothetical protein
MANYVKLTDTSKSFGGEYRNCAGTRDQGGTNLGIKTLPQNLVRLTVTITVTPNANGDGGLNRIQLRWPGGQILAETTASSTTARSITYVFGSPGNKSISELRAIGPNPTSPALGPYLDIRYINDAPGGGGFDTSDPCDYYRQDSEDTAVIKAYTGDTAVDGGDGRLTITVTDSAELETTIPPTTTSCPNPTPWNQLGVPDSCGSPPSTTTSANGINVTSSGNSVTINLSNYVNKLASINFSHSVGSSWSNGLAFNISQASDITVGSTVVPGNPYSKSSYASSSMPSSTTIKLANLDGGNYGYTFTHSSTPGPRPTRINYNLVCTTSTETVTSTDSEGNTVTNDVTTETCVCTPYTETYAGTWPPCPEGVYIVRTGGSTVEWVYSDGKDSSYSAQRAILTISGTRPIVPLTGPITLAVSDQSLYIKGMLEKRFSVKSYRDYVNSVSSPTNKFRFRNPIDRECLSEVVIDFDDDSFAAFSEFRSYAGAEPPQ